MAKNDLRAIDVDGRSYRWRVTRVDEDSVNLRLWKDGGRQPWADVAIRFEDVWLKLSDPGSRPAESVDAPVTPARVAEVVRYLLEHDLAGSVRWEGESRGRGPDDTVNGTDGDAQ